MVNMSESTIRSRMQRLVQVTPPSTSDYMALSNPLRYGSVKVIVGVDQSDRPVFKTLSLIDLIEKRSRNLAYRLGFEDKKLPPMVFNDVYGRVTNNVTVNGETKSAKIRFMELMYVTEKIGDSFRWITLVDASKKINAFVKTGAGPSGTSASGASASGSGDAGAGPSGSGDAGAGPSGAGDAGAGPSGAGDAGAGPSGRSSASTCVFCQTTDNEPGMFLAPCNSWSHKDCLDNCLKHFLNDLKCPKCPCSFYKTVDELDHEILMTTEMQNILTKAVRTRWRDAQASRRLNPKDLQRTCPTCNKVQSGVYESARTYYCTNPQCLVAGSWGICTKCNKVIVGKEASTHDCSTDSKNDALFLARAKRNKNVVMPCPGCSNAVEKEHPGQCNHISCTMCDIRYCGACQHKFSKTGGSWNYAHKCTSDNMYRIPDRQKIVDAIMNAM